MSSLSNVSKRAFNSDKEPSKWHTTKKRLQVIAEAYNLGWPQKKPKKHRVANSPIGCQVDKKGHGFERNLQEEREPSPLLSVFLAATFFTVVILGVRCWGIAW